MQICSHSLWNKQHYLISATSGCAVYMPFKSSLLSFWITRKFVLVQPPSCQTCSSPQDCIPFHYFFYGEDKGLWLFFLKNWKTFFMTLIFFKISFMENLAFVLVHVLRRTEAHRRLENVYFFHSSHFSLDN